jgi:hypothetical protein
MFYDGLGASSIWRIEDLSGVQSVSMIWSSSLVGFVLAVAFTGYGCNATISVSNTTIQVVVMSDGIRYHEQE